MAGKGRVENLKFMPPLGDEPMAKNPLCVRVRKDVDAAIRALPDKAAWMREKLTEAAIADGLIPPQSDEP